MSEVHGTIEQKIDNLKENFNDHRGEDRRDFGEIRGILKDMKENHLAHLQNDSAVLREETARQTADIDWMKRILWLFLVPIMGGFIAQIYSIISQ